MKASWILRRLILSVIFPKIHWYGYIGKPVLWKGMRQIVLKKGVRIYPGSRLEAHGEGEILINENTSIAQNFHCTAVGSLEIGKDSLITANVCITDIDHSSSQINEKPVNRSYEFSKTLIGEKCFIGMGTIIQAGTKIGSNSIIGANSVVRGNFPPYSMIAGVPAKIVRVFDDNKGAWVVPLKKNKEI